MAQFRTTADIVDAALRNAGETTSGTSSYESEALTFVNRVHYSIIAGGTIALGKDQTIEIDEVWPWSRAKRPMVLELQPAYETGTVTLTQSSEAGTFSSAPSYSVAGWYLRIVGREGVFRIASHTAADTAFELDAAYPDTTGSGLSFEVFKLDYDLTPDYLVIDSSNNKIDFKKTAGGSELTATLTAGAYTPSALATHVGSQMTTAASGPTITASYNSVTKKFSITTNASGSTTLLPLFATGTNQLQSAHGLLGYDDTDSSAGTTHTAVYIQGGIARLIEPIKVLAGKNCDMAGCDPEAFSRNYPFESITEGTPNRFAIIREDSDGSIRIRVNAYPEEKRRMEVEHVPVPRDLKDSAGSIPLVPRKHIDVLEDAATARLMFLKSDDRAPLYMQLVQGTLKSMIAQHRGALVRTGQHFGQLISRLDKMIRKGPMFGDPY